MAEKTIGGFCVWNIDVPLPTANPAIALLTAYLEIANVWMDLASNTLSNFVSWAFDFVTVLGRVVENAAGRREQLAALRPTNEHGSQIRKCTWRRS